MICIICGIGFGQQKGEYCLDDADPGVHMMNMLQVINPRHQFSEETPQIPNLYGVGEIKP